MDVFLDSLGRSGLSPLAIILVMILYENIVEQDQPKSWNGGIYLLRD